MRKTKEETEKSRRQLLDSAQKIFYQKGYASTRLEDIAKGASLTRGAFYWHFKNKFEVFKALLDQSFAETSELMDRYLRSKQDPYTKIRSLIHHLLNDRRRKEHEVYIFIKLYTEPDPELADLRSESRDLQQVVIPELARTIKEGIVQGDFQTPLEPEFIARTIFTFFWGFFSNPQSGNHDYSDSQWTIHIDEFINHLLGVKKGIQLEQKA